MAEGTAEHIASSAAQGFLTMGPLSMAPVIQGGIIGVGIVLGVFAAIVAIWTLYDCISALTHRDPPDRHL